jgi:hypothetical protein
MTNGRMTKRIGKGLGSPRALVFAGLFVAITIWPLADHFYWEWKTGQELQALNEVADKLHGRYPTLKAARSTHWHPRLLITGEVAFEADRDVVKSRIRDQLPNDADAERAANFIRIR